MGLNHSPLIMTNGLRQYLDAGNRRSYPGTGTAWNDIADGFNATLSTPTFSATDGGSFLFNGSSDYVSCGNLGTLTTQGTISVWFNTSSITNYRCLFSTEFNGLDSGIRVEQTGAGIIRAYIGDGTNLSAALSFGTITIGTWYKLDLTWDSVSGATIGYLNGVQVLNATNPYWPSTIPSLTLGVGYSSAISYRYFSGYITQLMVYGRQLSELEVLINFNAIKGRFTA